MGRTPPRLENLVDLPVDTPRLKLRLPSAQDVPALKRSFRDIRTARAVGAPLHAAAEMREPGKMVARTRAEFRRSEHLSLSVILRSSEECIGRVGLRGLDWNWRKVESLAYWIDPRWWNRGFATEASWFLCRVAFRTLRMRRIASQALEPNLASQAVLRRIGFAEEGRERRSVVVRGKAMDMILYGLLDSELRPEHDLRSVWRVDPGLPTPRPGGARG